MHFEEVERAHYKPNQAMQIDALRAKMHDQFGAVAQLEKNWDERESKKPSALALDNATRLMDELLDSVNSAGHSWLTPFVSSDEDGHITVAWHKGEHEMHLEISDDEVEYVTVWGVKIDTEMDVGVLSRDNYIPLWKWLLGG